MRCKRWAAMAATATLATGVVACGGGSSSDGGSAPGITKTQVTVGGHFPLTGPAAPGYSQIPVAIKAYFQQVNAEGGINGRKLKMIARDDGYNPTNTVKVTKQLVLQDKIFAMLGGLGTPTHSKVTDYLNSSRVPDLFVSSGCVCWNEPKEHPYTFGWQPDYLVEGKVLGTYVAENFNGKKIAYFGQNDDLGADGAKGLDRFIPKSQVVDRETYEPGNTDIGPQVAKMKASGADIVVAFSIPAYTALLKLNSLKLDYNPTFVVTNVGSDPATLSGLLKSFSKGKAGGELIDGIVSDTYLPPIGDPSDSWIKLFKGIRDKYAPKLPWTGNTLYGFSMAYTFAEALRKAGKNPTRKSIVAAVETGKLPGPGIVPFRYSADDHAGYAGVQVGTVKGGALQTTGKPMVTDDGSGDVTPSTLQPIDAPPNGVPPGS